MSNEYENLTIVNDLKKRIQALEDLVERHFQTMGEHVGALDRRVADIEKFLAGNNTLDEYNELQKSIGERTKR